MSISSKGTTTMTGLETLKLSYDKKIFSIFLKDHFPLNPQKMLTKIHSMLGRNTSMMMSKKFA